MGGLGSGVGDGFGDSCFGGCGFGVFGFGVGVECDDGAPHLALLQSTGRLTTGVQTFADFCFGLSGKQLLLSSNTMSFLGEGSHSGASPLK